MPCMGEWTVGARVIEHGGKLVVPINILQKHLRKMIIKLLVHGILKSNCEARSPTLRILGAHLCRECNIDSNYLEPYCYIELEMSTILATV